MLSPTAGSTIPFYVHILPKNEFYLSAYTKEDPEVKHLEDLGLAVV
jgi:hypothetical protein